MITLGVDVGSLTGKAVLLGDDGVLVSDLLPTGTDGAVTGNAVTENVLAQAGLSLDEVDFVVATGYGRIVIPFANRSVSEISCHAKGASWLFPTARTILDMGGQDCKAIRCGENGKVTKFVMNDKCAAGAGRSMGIMADLVDVPLADIGPMSLDSEGDGIPISSTCVVFARSEVLRHMRRGVSKNAVLAGACAALVERVESMLRRTGVATDFVISGGIAKNEGVVRRLEKKLNLEAKICAEPQIVGALGAAVLAREFAQRALQDTHVSSLD
jgi:benzoyl-CoA reductase subunit A